MFNLGFEHDLNGCLGARTRTCTRTRTRTRTRTHTHKPVSKSCNQAAPPNGYWAGMWTLVDMTGVKPSGLCLATCGIGLRIKFRTSSCNC